MPQAMGQINFADLDALATVATRRSHSLFAGACEAFARDVAARLEGARVLVVGGAGSIGSETVKLIANRPVAALHVADLSENYLADLVRDLRNRPGGLAAREFRTFTLDYGGEPMAHLLAHAAPYDFVLCFAAHKHVRGERDGYSLLSMVDTNILKLASFKERLRTHGHGRSLFSVSTDKAANPSSLMGASKRIMEDVLFAHARLPDARVTTARFANVAFSNGSLPQAFLRRLARGEPLAAPEATRRYFVAPREAGELCLLASVLGTDGTIAIPDLDPEAELVELQVVAEALLRRMGFEPHVTRDEAEALELARTRAGRAYPLLLTPLDTGGEKPFEEFVALGETDAPWLPGLRQIAHCPNDSVGAVVERLARIRATGGTEAEIAVRIRAAFQDTINQFSHRASDRNLDERL